MVSERNQRCDDRRGRRRVWTWGPAWVRSGVVSQTETGSQAPYQLPGKNPGVLLKSYVSTATINNRSTSSAGNAEREPLAKRRAYVADRATQALAPPSFKTIASQTYH